MRTSEFLGLLTIPNGQTVSNALPASSNLTRLYGTMVDFLIESPALLTGTISVQVTTIDSPSGSDWRIVSVGGSDVTVPASRAVVVPVGAIRGIRVSSSATEGADRVFRAFGQLETS